MNIVDRHVDKLLDLRRRSTKGLTETQTFELVFLAVELEAQHEERVQELEQFIEARASAPRVSGSN